jgi:hypothetical protein
MIKSLKSISIDFKAFTGKVTKQLAFATQKHICHQPHYEGGGAAKGKTFCDRRRLMGVDNHGQVRPISVFLLPMRNGPQHRDDQAWAIIF